MNLCDLIDALPPVPWAEGRTIPWDDPAFSARMLREHLSQEHDAASRRFAKIDRHVDWIHESLLRGQTTRVLDLCCGPGLYSSRLARRGHACLGIDYGPASIDYAQQEAKREGLACTYLHQDVRQAEYGVGYGLAMWIYGELNVFTRGDVQHILGKARAALDPGGLLLLEPSRYAAIRDQARSGQTWYASPGGLWSAEPHICLSASYWDEDAHVHTTRYHIVDPATGEVARHTASAQAYTDVEYLDLVEGCGFVNARLYPSLTGQPDPDQPGLLAVVAQAPAP